MSELKIWGSGEGDNRMGKGEGVRWKVLSIEEQSQSFLIEGLSKILIVDSSVFSKDFSGRMNLLKLLKLDSN